MNAERFWAKVDRSGGATACWPWLGARARNGYGSLWGAGYSRIAHRRAYELAVGPIPAGLDIDHLCRVRLCVNPTHLEPVTRQVNLLRSPLTLASRNARKTHCVRGHAFTPENIEGKRGKRECVTCRRQRYVRAAA